MSTQAAYIWPNLAGGPVISDRQGIDYLLVLPGQTDLEVHFLKPVSSELTEGRLYRIVGGERITIINVMEAIQVDDKVVRLTLDRFGDWAPYRLTLAESIWQEANIDPVFAAVDFSFKVNCPQEIDCRAHLPGFDRFPALRNFQYQAKDYESLKQAMVDRLAMTMPQAWDRAEADLAMMLVDLLAFAGDRLSYYQDRVAAESQLKTARARESVAGHLQLLDYALDPGETATVLVAFEVQKDMTVPAGTQVRTAARSFEMPVTFTLREPFPAFTDLNRLRLYDFGHPSLIIPEGALQVTILGHPEGLGEGSRLVLRQGEELSGWQYHLVELAGKPVLKKAPDGTDITVLTWGTDQALPWDAALSRSDLVGNIGELDHGTTWTASLYVDGVLEHYDLPEGPLGYRTAEPLITVKVDGELWQRVISLRESQPYDRHFQVADRDDGRNRVLFGDNVNGLRPEQYARIEVEYHAGLGTAGNVAAGTLSELAKEVPGVRSVRNFFPAREGREPETAEHGKMWGPKRLRDQLRAVTPDDYAREAMSVPGVFRAIARFVWTGSWVTVRVTLDPLGTEELSGDLRRAVLDHLHSRKMAGYDLEIASARYVPLKIRVRCCLQELAFRDQVLRDLRTALGSGVGADGVKGFFHPDRWTFGQGVKLSHLYAAVARVQGIECAEVLTFERLRKPQSDELTEGEIPMQWDEIARLDNDPNFPERGRLDLELVGGR